MFSELITIIRGDTNMNRVILICGKVCSGKTIYAKLLIKKNPAVLLSLDEITTLFFGQNGGAEHYVILEKAQKYLFNKSLEIIKAGSNVIRLGVLETVREERRKVIL